MVKRIKIDFKFVDTKQVNALFEIKKLIQTYFLCKKKREPAAHAF